MSTELTTQESNFITFLLEGQSVVEAAENAGYYPTYGYSLKKRLSKEIIEAAEDYLALHSIKAARTMVQGLDPEPMNQVRLTAAGQILDRVGVIKKETIVGPTIKQNIFILPAKKVIDIE